MNLVLLFPEDFVDGATVRLAGRRARHVISVHRASKGDTLRVGLLGGRIGSGRIVSLDPETIEIEVILDTDPPLPIPLSLILALPRPKVLNRVIGAVTTLGVKRIDLVNSWRVEKSYWFSPRLTDENLRQQAILGLEQSRDTMLPEIRLHRLFVPFVENELPDLVRDSMPLVAHPGSPGLHPGMSDQAITLAIGPEGGFIEPEIRSLTDAGFTLVGLGERILPVETAIAYAAGLVSRSR